MATYKYGHYLNQTNHEAFDTEYGPGKTVPWSGIYRCMGCGWEIAANESTPFPPQNHHQHSVAQGSVRWKLVTYAVHKT